MIEILGETEIGGG